MVWFHKKRSWNIILYGLVFFILILTDCATVTSSRKYVGLPVDSNSLDQREAPFRTLWEKWTIRFGGSMRSGGSRLLGNSLTLSTGDDRGGGEGEFPLQITATLMDSSVIEAGLKYYSDKIEMTLEEKAEFRNTYYKRYDVENHLLIWCELQTSWTDLFLDPDRWLIFIEDDQVNQHEPVQVLEESTSTGQKQTDSLTQLSPEPRYRVWRYHQKALMLCFPKRDYYKNPILSEQVKYLKLIFQQKDDEKSRAEGIWVFKK
jgi:hypothetical protein